MKAERQRWSGMGPAKDRNWTRLGDPPRAVRGRPSVAVTHRSGMSYRTPAPEGLQALHLCLGPCVNILSSSHTCWGVRTLTDKRWCGLQGVAGLRGHLHVLRRTKAAQNYLGPQDV